MFLIDGVTYLHIKEGGVQMVVTTRDNVSPSFCLEFLRRMCIIIKDYCGMLSEDAIRKNFVLIYELVGASLGSKAAWGPRQLCQHRATGVLVTVPGGTGVCRACGGRERVGVSGGTPLEVCLQHSALSSPSPTAG